MIGHDPAFPFAVPIAPPEFAKRSPMLDELIFDLEQLEDPARGALIDAIFAPRFAKQRQQETFCDFISDREHIRELYRAIRTVPREKQPFAVIAASIIANLDPIEIFENADITLTKSERDLICVTVDTVYQPVDSVSMKANGKVWIEKCRPQIPPPLIRFLKSVDLLTAKPPEVKKEVHDMSWFAMKRAESVQMFNGAPLPEPDVATLREIKAPNGFYSEDISNGFNKRNGLPDVRCYNDIDGERPLIIKWVGELNVQSSGEGLQSCDGCDCLHCHQRDLRGGQKSLCYKSNGKIDIVDLATHARVIVECNDTCRCNKATCPNRAIQNRWKWNLIVVRTETEFGWSVRTLDFIPCGSFVCDFLGRTMQQKRELEACMTKCKEMGQMTFCNLDAEHVPAADMLIMDTRDHGNIATFIEPKPIPNLIPISMVTSPGYSSHVIALFATRDIYPNEEISYHPNYDYNWEKKLAEIHGERL